MSIAKSSFDDSKLFRLASVFPGVKSTAGGGTCKRLGCQLYWAPVRNRPGAARSPERRMSGISLRSGRRRSNLNESWRCPGAVMVLQGAQCTGASQALQWSCTILYWYCKALSRRCPVLGRHWYCNGIALVLHRHRNITAAVLQYYGGRTLGLHWYCTRRAALAPAPDHEVQHQRAKYTVGTC